MEEFRQQFWPVGIMNYKSNGQLCYMLASAKENQDMYTTCENGQQVGAVNSQILADILQQFFYVVPVSN